MRHPDDLEIDHLRPFADGGPASLANSPGCATGTTT